MGNATDVHLTSGGPLPSPLPSVSVELTVTPALSLALAHAAVPVVSQLTLTGADAVLRGVTVRLTVQDTAGPLGTPVERHVDLDPGRSVVLTDLGLVLDPAALQRVQEPHPGWVGVDLVADGRLLGQHEMPVQVLTARQWLAAPLPLALELLAAHVRPADPAIGELVADASALLEEGTGNASMAGYGGEPDRVDEVVEALTWALRRREVSYREAPDRWDATGQRIRTPGEVLDGRLGTSLDTVLTLAAALEQVGIRPLLWLVEGHAFLGYWRAERAAETAATTDVAALVELVDQGLVRLVETTLLTDRGNTSADLHGPAYSRWLTGDLSRVIGVTDVARARRDGVSPLPTDSPLPTAAPLPAAPLPPAPLPASSPLSTAAPLPAAPLPVAPPGDGAPLTAEDDDASSLPARLRVWTDALLHLGPGNPLIDSPEGAGLRLAVPPEALPTLADLVAAGTTLTLLPGDRPTPVQVGRGAASAHDLSVPQLTELLTGGRSVHLDAPQDGWLPQLRALAARARSIGEQTGANDLHLALGSLDWELDGRPLRSPLVLVPVVLTTPASGGPSRLTLDESGASSPNWCLLDTLRSVHGLTVPGVDTPAADGVGIDLPAALAALRAALAAAGLPFLVEDSAELAVLPAARYRLRHDLTEHWTDFAASPLVAALLADPAEPFADPFADPAPDTAGTLDLDELAAQCPLRADGSQLRAVAEGIAGRTFVLEGAPGTGKSQTVTNLLARSVAEGRRVLFVAGQRTALDVVARRLDAVGLGPVTLDLHGAGSRPAVVRAQVRAALDHAVQLDTQGLATGTADLHSSAAGLQRYAEQLHAQNPVGTSFWSARTAVLGAPTDVLALPVTNDFAARSTPEAVTEVHHALALLPDIAGLARPSAGHAWGFLDTIDIDITTVQQAAVAVDTAVRDLPSEGGLAAVVRAARDDADLDAIVHLLAGPRIDLEVLDEVRTPRWAAATDDLTSGVADLVAAEHAGLDVATPAVLDLPLAELFVRAQEAAASSVFGRRGKLVAVREQLAPALRPGATVRPGDVPQLTADLRRVQTAVQSIAGRAAVIPGLQVPAGWNPFSDAGRPLLDAEVRWLRRAAASVEGGTPFGRAMRRFLAAGPVSDPPAARTVARLRDTLAALLTACSSSSAQLAAWSGDDGLVLRWTMTRPERGVEYVHPMSLRRWVSLLDTLEPLRLAGLTEARDQLRHGVVRADDAVRAFERGLAEAAVAERRESTGLDAFDAGLHELTVARFASASRAVRSHLIDALPAGVLAARPSDAGSTDGRVGALRRELAGQRSGLDVRGLLARYGDLVTAVTPCVLATPDTVTRYLPAQADLFDLVVFDEASQLLAAEAIGALGRARSAVVVGDSRQLPPAVARTAGADAGTDAESILTACLRAGVPRRELSWHYRSRDESLIAFSNAHYYGDRLRSFPGPVHRGVSLLRVDGTPVRSDAGLRTNPAEAGAVVAEVLRRFAAAAPAVPSIAVVTVDGAQATLVEHLLRDSGDDRVAETLDRTDGEGLLVRDLETVQGEERDVVLLSLGAGPDAHGRVRDVGPLGRAGGERRLNVAVTRARRQVVVVSSFDPEQLRAEDTASVGAQHLRGYLDLAALGTDALLSVRPPADRQAHRDEVAAELRSRGLVVRTDVGLSDFRLDLTVAPGSAPGSPVLAVLLDGPAWAERTTVGDRDGLPEEVLGELIGWPAVERVWLPTWLADREAVLSRLVAVVAQAAPEPVAVAPVAVAPVAVAPVAVDPVVVEPVVVQPADDGPLAEVIQLRRPAHRRTAEPEPAAAEPVPSKAVLSEPLVSEPVVTEPVVTEPVVTEPVVTEPVDSGPTAVPEPVTPLVASPAAKPAAKPAIKPATKPATRSAEPLDEEQPFLPWAPKPAGEKKQLDQLSNPAVARLVRRVLTAGVKAEGPVHRDRLARLTVGAFGLSRVTEARRDALLALLPAGAVDGDFVWPASIERATWHWFRRQATSTGRPLDQVAPEEIGNAMAALCRAGGGLTEDELQLRTLEVFGRRRTPALLPLLDTALSRAVASGRLIEQPTGRFTA